MKTNILLLSLLLLAGAFTYLSCTPEMQKALERAERASGQTSNQRLSNEEVIRGLKEALTIGAQNAGDLASRTNGFYNNNLIKIPFPEEAEKVKETALDLGLNTQVDRFVKTLNEAAELASKEAAPIFANAIRNMTVRDGFEILNGHNHAATEYLERNTTSQLTNRFTPIVKDAIEKVELTRYWNPLITRYNDVNRIRGGESINPDLDAYVTEKAIEGLFKLVALEEEKIRKDPVARVTDLLERVFGS